MSDKSLKYALYFLGIAFVLTLVSLGIFSYTDKSSKLHYTFAEASANPSLISSISLEFPEQKITFDKGDDQLWLVRNAESYPANYKFMTELLQFISSSAIYRQVDLSSEEKQPLFAQGVRINLYDKAGNLLDTVLLGSKNNNHQMSYAQIGEDDETFMVENNIRLPSTVSLWLQQPLLSIDKSLVKSISINKQTASRSNRSLSFINTKTKKEVRLDNLLQALNFVGFTDIRSAQNFDEQSAKKIKDIKIEEFNGLIFNLSLFKHGDEYWLKQSLSSAPLAHFSVQDFIQNSEFLYKYWYFQLHPKLGQILSSAQI